MQLTPEQKAIVAATGDVKINAVAGSGKTSTLLAVAAAQPPRARGLYLAFNRTVKVEARERFTAAGLAQVRVETAHSLAYAHVVRGRNYQVRSSSYRPYELAQLLGLEHLPEAEAQSAGRPAQARTFAYVLAAHVARAVAAFCNSAVATVRALNYPASVEEPKARLFAQAHGELIERQARRLLQLFERGLAEMPHDFYLKKFQLEKPELGFDYIMFDEAQDASGAMLDWVMAQRARKIIVGDTHQQIYSWRGAVNSLEAVAFATLPLSTSFRFGPDVAKLASAVLAYKAPGGTLPVELRVPLTGAGRSERELTRAVIGRSNLGLLVKAIAYVTGPHAVERIYFEGNLSAYIYGSEGGSLYDLLHLQNGRPDKVRDQLLASMSSLDEVVTYAAETGDKELELLIELVDTYGEQLFDIIADLKRRQVPDHRRHEAQIFFSTVHRCKGLEYDLVELAPDFLTREDVLRYHARQLSPAKPTPAETVQFNEQVNLLYVALTRTRYRLWLSEECLPLGHRLPTGPEGQPGPLVAYPGLGTTYLTQPGRIQTARPRPAARAAESPAPVAQREQATWTTQEERMLVLGFCQDMPVLELAVQLRRTAAEVRQRIQTLGLEALFNLSAR